MKNIQNIYEEMKKVEKDILHRLYQTIREREPNEEYKNLAKEYSKEKEEFIKKIGENNRADLDKLTSTIYDLDNILSFADFCDGFEFCLRLFLECIYKNKGDDQE